MEVEAFDNNPTSAGVERKTEENAIILFDDLPLAFRPNKAQQTEATGVKVRTHIRWADSINNR